MNYRIFAFTLPVALLFAGDQAWKDKSAAEWSDDDAKQVLSDSPWAKSVTPEMKHQNAGSQRRSGGGGGGMGRGGGINIGGIGIGLPGMGGIGGRRGGGGRPPAGGGGYPPNGGSRDPEDQGGRDSDPPALTLRWESALPIRTAELKARETSAPDVDERHYAIAVYGVPGRFVSSDTRTQADQLKKEAAIQRDGKKDLKATSVQILNREDGAVIVYLFPRSTEITKSDNRLHFNATIGRLQFTGSFYVDEMIWQGKLEL